MRSGERIAEAGGAAVKPAGKAGGALPLGVNAAAGLGSYVAAALITFFLSPYLIRTLGDGRYGVWSLIAEITGYASLLDIGLRGAVTYFVAYYSGRGDSGAIRGVAASAFWTLAGLGLVAAGAGMAVAAAFPVLFRTGTLDQQEIFWSMTVLAVMIGLTLPCSLLHSILVGFRRQAFANAADIGARILAAGGIALALSAGGGLVEISLITLGGRLAAWGVQAWMVWQGPHGISLRPAWFSRERLRDLAGYGAKSLVINLALMVIHRVDLVVVSAFVGIEKVTVYTLGATLVGYLSQLISSVTQSYAPYFSRDAGADDPAQLRRRFAAGMRLASLLAGLLAGGLAAFGSPFLALWVGARFVAGPWTDRSDAVMAILLAAHLPRVLQSISWQLLYGTRRVGFLMWLNVGEAAANLTASLILVRHFGLAGVALGTLAPSLAAHGLLMPRYVMKSFGISAGDYLWRAPRAGYLTGLATAAAGFALTAWRAPANWAEFFAEALTAGLAGGLCIWRAGLEPDEKRKLLALLPGRRGGEA